MAWQDELRPASFKGVTFSVGTYDHRGGLNGAHHEYAARDHGSVEHLSKMDDEFSVEAVLIGDDCLKRRDDLLKVIWEPGPGELVHPWYGHMQVSTAPGNGFSISGKGGEGRAIRVKMNFIRAEAPTGPILRKNTKAEAEQATITASEIAKNNLIENLQTAGQPGFVLEELKQDLEKLETLSHNLAVAGGLVQLQAVAASTLKTAAEVADKISAASKFVGGGTEIFQALVSLPAKFVDVLPAIPNSVGQFASLPRKMQALNRDLITGYTTATTALSYASTAIGASFESYDGAVDVLKQGQELLDDAIHSAKNDELVVALDDARASFTTHIKATSGDLSRIVQVTHRTTEPAVLRAYDLYEDLDRETDIVARNKIKHPGKLHPGNPLEVLSV